MSILRFKEETNAEKDKYTQHNKRIREMNYKLKIYGTLITAIIGKCFNKRSTKGQHRSNHGQITVKSRSNHDQITVKSRSNHGEITVKSRSNHDQITVKIFFPCSSKCSNSFSKVFRCYVNMGHILWTILYGPYFNIILDITLSFIIFLIIMITNLVI